MYLEVKNVSKKISGEIVLKNIQMTFEKGKIYGLQGKNGSGKTMIMRVICGLIRPTEGQVIVNGEILGMKKDFLPSAGALIENPGFIQQFSGYENLKMLADIRGKIGKEEIINTLEKVGLGDVIHKKYKKYSLGMKQKLGIAAAIMEDPEVILLDEPTNALDEESIVQLHHLLEEYKTKGTLIIISCHDREELEILSDEIYEIESGRVKCHRKAQNEKIYF